MAEFADLFTYADAAIAAVDFVLVVGIQCAGGKETVVHERRAPSSRSLQDIESGAVTTAVQCNASVKATESDTETLLPPFGFRSDSALEATGVLERARAKIWETKVYLAQRRNEETGYKGVGAVATFVFFKLPAALVGPALYYADTASDVLLMLNLYDAGTDETELWASLTVGFLAAQYLGAWLGVLMYFKGSHGIFKEELKGWTFNEIINFLLQHMEWLKDAPQHVKITVLASTLLGTLLLGWQTATVLASGWPSLLLSIVVAFPVVAFTFFNPFWFSLCIGPILVVQLSFWSSRLTFPTWLFYKGFVWYALIFMPVPLALDLIMFLEPLGLLWLVPSTQLHALVPAYMGTRTLLEVNFEGLPQSVLQIYIFARVMSGDATAAGGTLDGVDQTVLIRSLTLSLLGFSKVWFENYMTAKNRSYLADDCLTGMRTYLQDQLQMGAGLPMNAIESGQTTKWKSPFRPTSVAQLEVLCTALIQEDAKLVELDVSGGAIDMAGVVVLCDKGLKINRSLISLDLSRNDLGVEAGKALADMLSVNGVVTSIDLSNNYLDAEVGKAIAEALKSGTSVVTSLDISYNELGPEGGKAFAEALPFMSVLTSLSLQHNQLCGIDYQGKGTYDASGIQALASAISVSPMVLNTLSLADNYLTNFGKDMTGVLAIADALKSGTSVLKTITLDGYGVGFPLPVKQLKGTEPVESLDLSLKGLGMLSGIVIAKLIEFNSVMTSLSLANNQLCGLNWEGKGTYDASGIKAIAEALQSGMGVLTELE